jgi:DNA processing protein
VLDAVPKVAGVGSASIAKTAGIALPRTREALLVLHRAGLVEHALGRWRLAPDGPEDTPPA